MFIYLPILVLIHLVFTHSLHLRRIFVLLVHLQLFSKISSISHYHHSLECNKHHLWIPISLYVYCSQLPLHFSPFIHKLPLHFLTSINPFHSMGSENIKIYSLSFHGSNGPEVGFCQNSDT